jgi:hypothetical protein
MIRLSEMARGTSGEQQQWHTSCSRQSFRIAFAISLAPRRIGTLISHTGERCSHRTNERDARSENLRYVKINLNKNREVPTCRIHTYSEKRKPFPLRRTLAMLIFG